MQDIRIDGMGDISGGAYGTVKIDGMANCNGDMQVETLDIDGKLKMHGCVTADLVDCDGMTEINGSLHVKKMLVDGFLTVAGNGNLEAEQIDCDGCIKVDGQISADHLNANGMVKAKEIVGDTIIIQSHVNHFLRFFVKNQFCAELIEATTIRLRGVTVQTVNGSCIEIGPGCVIDHVDCNGTLKIDASSTVKTITGNYTVEP